MGGGGGGGVAAAVAAAGGVSPTWDGDVLVTPQRQVPAVSLRRRGGASIQFLDRALDSPVMQRRSSQCKLCRRPWISPRCRSWTRF